MQIFSIHGKGSNSMTSCASEEDIAARRLSEEGSGTKGNSLRDASDHEIEIERDAQHTFASTR
jgi:hypothetical protein